MLDLKDYFVPVFCNACEALAGRIWCMPAWMKPLEGHVSPSDVPAVQGKGGGVEVAWRV